MNEKIVFQIGPKASPLSAAPFRAFVYWLNQGKLLRAEDFSELELVREIERLRKQSTDEANLVNVFEDALADLKKSNSSK